jgi:hypothetical protein
MCWDSNYEYRLSNSSHEWLTDIWRIKSYGAKCFVIYIRYKSLEERLERLLPWRWGKLVLPNRWSLSSELHGVTIQKIVILKVVSVRTSNLTKKIKSKIYLIFSLINTNFSMEIHKSVSMQQLQHTKICLPSNCSTLTWVRFFSCNGGTNLNFQFNDLKPSQFSIGKRQNFTLRHILERHHWEISDTSTTLFLALVPEQGQGNHYTKF